MAYNEIPKPEEQQATVAPAPVVEPVVAPVATTPIQTAPAPVTQPILSTPQTSAIYSPTNISQIDIPSTNKAMNMKLSDLEKKLSKANSIAELNQIAIMNQPKAMGVLTGEAAYRSKLDTARVNAFNSLYNNRLVEEQRKETKRQQFIETYGADPNSRPKGMSKREFAKAIQGGGFSNLLTEDFKQKQLQTAAAKKSLSGGGTVGERQGSILANAENSLLQSRGNDGFADPNVYRQQRQQYVSQGGSFADFDSQFGQYLSPQEQQTMSISSGGEVDQWLDLLSRGQATIANVPQAIRNEVVSRLAATGTEVNKQLSDSAIAAITETQQALYGLNDLAQKISGNEQYLGPVSGLQRFNPYSKARQIQSDVDRIRQVVGKALEGGVLRKEDEEKYKKILATLADTPETALYKIEALKSDLERKIADYKIAQAGAGRYVQGVSGVNQEDLRTKYNY